MVVAVALDGSSRRFGLAVVVTSGSDWRIAVEEKLRSLPNYARPQLFQVVRQIPHTATHKPQTALWREGRWEPILPTARGVEGSGNSDAPGERANVDQDDLGLFACDNGEATTFAYRHRLEAITWQNWDMIRGELLG